MFDRVISLYLDSSRCTFLVCFLFSIKLCSCLTTASDVHLARVSVFTCEKKSEKKQQTTYTQPKKKKHKENKRNNNKRSPQPQQQQQQHGERRDNFWTLFQAWLIHMSSGRIEYKNKKTKRLFSRRVFFIRFIASDGRIFRHLASQWERSKKIHSIIVFSEWFNFYSLFK